MPRLHVIVLMPVQGQGVIDAVISQNIDGLHLRSGLPASCLYELHGNSFIEQCRCCRKTHFRPFDVKGMSSKPTGRLCEGVQSAAARLKRARYDVGAGAGSSVQACKGVLHDFMLDWGDALPAAQLRCSERLCQRALCLLCLGTSLYINPCGLLPTRTKKSGGKVVIVSLSETAQDGIADIMSRTEADVFMATLCSELNIAVPCFVPSLTFYVAQASTLASALEGGAVRWQIAISACSDGQPSPLPHILRATARARSHASQGGGDVQPAADCGCKLERCKLYRTNARLQFCDVLCCWKNMQLMQCGCSECDGSSVRKGWVLQGEAAAPACYPLHVSLELVWRSALSRPHPLAAEQHDTSLIELELCLEPAASSPAFQEPSVVPQGVSAGIAGLQQMQSWHRIGRL